MQIVRDMISYVGIAATQEYVQNPYAFKQFILKPKITVPVEKPDIESIIKVLAVAQIKNIRQIKTPYKNKLVVEGVVKQRFVYTAANAEQSVHSFTKQVVFCDFIEFDCEPECVKTKVVIEDINILHHDHRMIDETKILCIIVQGDEDEECEEE